MKNAAAEPAQGTNGDVERLHELNRGYVRAAQRSDVAWYEEHLDPEFMSSDPDGVLRDRSEFLSRIGRPNPNTDLEARDVRIRVIGELGVIQSGFRCRTAAGQLRNGCYTDVWSRKSGNWLCVSAHFAMF
jgi:hypothetical protein